MPHASRLLQCIWLVAVAFWSEKERFCNKSCQKTTTLAGRQPSLNRSHGLSFSKVGQTSRSRSRGKKLWYHVKGLVTRNTHVRYESPISFSKKVMTKVKVFQK